MRRLLLLSVLTSLTSLVFAGLSEPANAGTVPDVTPPTATFTASNGVLSPNGDGRKEAADLSFTASEPVWADVHVFNSGGTSVRLLADESELKTTATYRWDGLRDDGTRLPDGLYNARLTVTDEAGNAAFVKVPLRLDTVAPLLRWRVAGGSLGAETLRASFTTQEAVGPVKAQLSLVNAYGFVARSWSRDLPLGDASLFVPKRAVVAAGPGVYRVAARLEDAAGNRRSVTTPPYKAAFQTPNRLVARFEGAGGRVSLTFDDCIFGSSWDAILSTLARHSVKAAFFCPGLQVQAHPDQAARTLRNGHTVGAHGWDHAKMSALSYSQSLWRLRADRDVWWRWRQAGTPYFRPPYGAFDLDVRNAAGQSGYRWTVLWDFDARDWSDPGPAVIASRVLSKARSGSLILLHVKPQTAAALPLIIKGLRSRGLEPVGLDQLVHTPGARPNPMGW